MTDDERRIGERRTLAMRGPGAAGVTPAHSLAASNPCLNCGTNVQLEYCPECGQREIDSDPTLGEFLHELAEEFLHWDGKLLTTFRLLVARPGELTREYVAGRRVRYISPLRLYLTCSLVFFFVAAVVPQPPRTVVHNGRKISTQVGLITITESDSAATIAALDSMAQHRKLVSRVWGKHFGTAMRQRAAVTADMTAAVPKTMFVLVPLFAALVMLVFRRMRRRFPQHLAFALHVHAFMFLVLTAMLVRRFIPTVVPAIVLIELVCFGAIITYLVQSMRNVYGVRTREAIGRSALVVSAYFTMFLMAMLGTFVLIVLTKF